MNDLARHAHFGPTAQMARDHTGTHLGVAPAGKHVRSGCGHLSGVRGDVGGGAGGGDGRPAAGVGLDGVV